MLFREDTVYSADSVEFCPHPDFRNLLACGTYQLEPPKEPPASSPPDPDLDAEDDEPTTSSAPHKRLGRCLMYSWDDDTQRLTELYRLDQPAILDMKWSHSSATSHESPLLAIADAEGHVALHRWDPITKNLTLEQNVACGPDNVLCLSIDWSGRVQTSARRDSLVVSRSDGYLSIISPGEANFEITDEWHAHDFEPWIAAWNYWDLNLIYSGGDDCKLKGWDARQGFDQPTSVNKRFDAGVTTIQSHPHTEHLLAVGSYDSTVRLFDTRNLSRPIASVPIGGGAWRVKWHPNPQRKNDLLVVCMHDGFKVVHFDFDSSSGEASSSASTALFSAPHSKIIAENNSHESLAYGADWRWDDGNVDKSVIASCSFYDHMLSIWQG